MTLARRHNVEPAPLRTTRTSSVRVAAPKRRVAVAVLSVFLVLAVSFGAGGFVQQQKAKATVPVTDLFCVTCYLNRLLDEVDEITVDQIRKLVIKEITKKVIEKVIYGEGGGTGIGGALGTSGGGSGAFINDYAQFLYVAASEDVRSYIDSAYSQYLPSYISPDAKTVAQDRFDPNYSPIPSDCVDFRTIGDDDPEAFEKWLKALQPGCYDASASAFLIQVSEKKYAEIVEASKTEALANAGTAAKDEKTNKLKQSGIVYQGIVQGALEAVYNVQTQSESAVSQIIGALVDQVMDEILSEVSE